MTPPLGELYDLLRADGFPIGIDDHVRIGRLLARDATWDEDTLRTAIAALIVKDVRDRARFDACWERWTHAAAPLVEERPPPPPPSPRRWPWALAALAAIVAGSFAVWIVARGPHGVRVPADAPPPPPADAAPETATAPVEPAPHTDVPPPPPHSLPPEPSHDARAAALAVAAGGVGLLALLAGVAAFAGRRRRRFLPGPWRYKVSVPEAKKPALSRLDVEDGAADMTWQANEQGHELDIDRTVARTAAAGGMPVIAYRRPPAAPRYLVLEDVGAGCERWRFLYDELLRGLAREGVELERATFVGSPETCRTKDGKDVPLRDLLEQMDAMIAIGDGAAAIDPLTGERAEWLATLRHVPRRLWINPLPTARWSEGARAIAVDTPMEHGIAHALAALHAGVDRTDLERGFPAIIERAPATTTALAALRAYLGERAFQLVGAVATAGEPTIAAARWLAEQLELRLEEQEWLRVVALPWFVAERWPEPARARDGAARDGAATAGLRDRLREALAIDAPDVATRVDVLADRILAASEPKAGSAAHLAWQLERAERAGGDYAARELGRITATPLAHAARQRLAALGLPDRRRRWAIGSAAAACIVTLGGAGAVVATQLHDSHALADYAARAKERHLQPLSPTKLTIQLPWNDELKARVVDGNGDFVAGQDVYWSFSGMDEAKALPPRTSDAAGVVSYPLMDPNPAPHEGTQEIHVGDETLAFAYTIVPAPEPDVPPEYVSHAPVYGGSLDNSPGAVEGAEDYKRYEAQARQAIAQTDCEHLEEALAGSFRVLSGPKASLVTGDLAKMKARNQKAIDECWGQRAATAFDKVIADHKPYLRACYAKKPNLPAVANVSGTIRKDGTVTKLDITGLDGGDVEHCMIEELKGVPAGRYSRDVELKTKIDFGAPAGNGKPNDATLKDCIARFDDESISHSVHAELTYSAAGVPIDVQITGVAPAAQECMRAIYEQTRESPSKSGPATRASFEWAADAVAITDVIRFSDGNGVEVVPAEDKFLNDVIATMKAHPRIRVQAVGYSGEAPTGEKDARDWAAQRAQNVVKRLVALGADASRLSYAAGALEAPTADPKEQALRRRVEFRVLPPAATPSKKGNK